MQFGLTELLFPATPEGKFVNILILIVFAWGICRTSLLWYRVRRERKALTHVRDALARFKPDEGEEAAQHTVQTLAGLRLRTGLAVVDPAPLPTTLIGKRLHSLWQLRNNGRGGYEALGAIEETRQLLHSDMPRYLTSILVLMGLAGTILGLRGIIDHLNGALAEAATGPAALLQALEPMRSAFSCSLLGIATSVILAWALTFTERSQGELLVSLEETVTLQLMPLILPASEEVQLHRMTGVLESSQQFLTDFGRTIEESRAFFAETLGTAVRSAAQELQGRLSEATSALQKSLDEMRGTAATLSESTQNVVQYRAELEAERRQLEDYLRESAKQLASLSRAVLDPLQLAADGLVANGLAIKEVVLGNNEARETLREETAIVVDTLHKMTKAMMEEKNAITGMAVETRSVLTASATEFSKQIAGHAVQAKESAQILDTLMRQVNPEMLTLPNGKILGKSLSEVSQKLEKLDDSLMHLFGRMHENLSGVGAKSQETNTQIQILIGAVQNLLASSDRQDMEKAILQQQLAANEASRATLQELRLLRAHMEKPPWRTWIGQTNGNGQGR